VTQNTSSAVMAQRREPKDSLDDFPTPPWATRALCEFLLEHGLIWPGMSVREPAANRGHMARALGEYFSRVIASDVADYGAGFPIDDFLMPGNLETAHWTITNPPFRLAEEFLFRALQTTRHGVALLGRTSFLEGIGRHERVFSQAAPDHVLQFSERVVMHKARLSKDGSTATAYCWLIWRKDGNNAGSTLHWTGVCRSRLERPGDYP
jgi:hypothetical protein